MVNRSTRDPAAVPEPVNPNLASEGANLGDMDIADDEDLNDRVLAGEEVDVHLGSDISPDRIVPADEAGLGGGLDQAEEAQLGITDEEIEELARRTPK